MNCNLKIYAHNTLCVMYVVRWHPRKVYWKILNIFAIPSANVIQSNLVNRNTSRDGQKLRFETDDLITDELLNCLLHWSSNEKTRFGFHGGKAICAKSRSQKKRTPLLVALPMETLTPVPYVVKL